MANQEITGVTIMNNQMLDGNSAAELNHDEGETEIQEYRRELAEAEQWREIRDTLLSGKKWYVFGASFDLNERIIEKYKDSLNPDYNFVEGFLAGDLDPALKNLVQREADSFATYILERS
jgi:hypothetical protein